MPRPRPPAETPDERENQLIADAYDLAEKQIAEGRASAAVLTHFLRMGSAIERTRMRVLQEQEKRLRAQTEQIQSQQTNEKLYLEAIAAMRRYDGRTEDYSDDLL